MVSSCLSHGQNHLVTDHLTRRSVLLVGAYVCMYKLLYVCVFSMLAFCRHYLRFSGAECAKTVLPDRFAQLMGGICG